MNALNRVLDVVKKNAMVVALIAALLFFQILMTIMSKGSLLSPMNITNLIAQNAYVIILAVGMLLCITSSGNIDLSVGSTVVLVAAIVGTVVVTWHLPVGLGIAVGLLTGIAIGAWQGLWIAYVRIPAFIVTLAGMLLFRGIAWIILNGLTISPFPQSFNSIFGGYLPSPGFLTNASTSFIKALNTFAMRNPGNFISNFVLNNQISGKALFLTLIIAVIAAASFLVSQIVSRRRQKKAGAQMGNEVGFLLKTVGMAVLMLLFGLLVGLWQGISTVLVIIIVIIAVYSYLTQRTVPGRHIYAMGGNEKAAKLSGVNTNRLLFLAYTNMGFLAAVAALVCLGRFNSAMPSLGDGYELDAIASCFIGGASAFGGIGRVSGAVIGALFMGVLNIGMSIVGIDANWQKAVKGLVLLIAVVFDVLSKRRTTSAA